jgi:hypothetical protein
MSEQPKPNPLRNFLTTLANEKIPVVSVSISDEFDNAGKRQDRRMRDEKRCSGEQVPSVSDGNHQQFPCFPNRTQRLAFRTRKIATKWLATRN